MPKEKKCSVRIPCGTIHRTIALLQGALCSLDVDIDDSTVEKIGVMVHRAMSMQNRSFHTPEHIFDLADPSDPHSTLAAVFHDVIYYQVDNGFQEEIEKVINPYINIEDQKVMISKKIDNSDRAFYGTASVFGFAPGQALSPFAGLNEFLSALLMNCLLEGRVKDSDLLIATAMIEMTIPFRGPDIEGRFPGEALELRLRKTCKKFGLDLSDEEIFQAVVSAVRLSNRDVRNFAEEDPGMFLDNTWKLLPESNPDLNFHGLYTIQSYSSALMKMEGFLSQLKAETVFQQFAGYPDQTSYEILLKNTSANLKTAGVYLGIKIISAGILLALAELSGGDAPMSFFMGEIDHDDKWSLLTSHLPENPECSDNNKDDMLLKYGRTNSSVFDLRNSPLSLFLYCFLDEKQQLLCIDSSRKYLKGEQNDLSYLKTIPPYLVESIARAASVTAFTRRELLRQVADSFAPYKSGNS